MSWSATSTHFFNTSRNGDSTTSLGSLPVSHACPWLTHHLMPLVADFAPQTFIQWEVVCSWYTSEKLWNHWERAVTFPDCWSGQQSQPREPLCPSQLAPYSSNEWVVTSSHLYNMAQSFPGSFVIAQAMLFKVAVSDGQITFQLSSPCTEGDYS